MTVPIHRPNPIANLGDWFDPFFDDAPRPAFPVEVLPDPFRRFIEQGAANLDCKPELIALPVLGLTAGVIGNGYIIQIKRDWKETPNLWLAVVAPPGAAKTPAVKYAMEPISRLQKAAFEEYQYRLSEYEHALDEYDRRKRDKNQPTPEKPEKPELEHFFTTDSTIEALGRILNQDNTPGVTMLRDELVSWVASFDAYRQAGDRQQWMQFWAGVAAKVDRASKDATFIERPSVSVVGGIQPDLLARLEEEASLRDGFLDRFLFAYPEPKQMRFTDDSEETGVADAVRKALSSLRGHQDTRDVQLSHEARELFREFYNGNATEQENQIGLIQGYMAKLPGQLARLALILHCMEHPRHSDSHVVSAATMYQAITLIAYFQQHAVRVFEHFGIVAQLQDPLAARIVRTLGSCGGSATTSELNEALGGHVKSRERDRALELLESAGMIDREPIPTGAKGGRPGYCFILRDSPYDKTGITDKTLSDQGESKVISVSSVMSHGVSLETSRGNEQDDPAANVRALYDSGCFDDTEQIEIDGAMANPLTYAKRALNDAKQAGATGKAGEARCRKLLAALEVIP